jgi:SlyX protein
MTQTNEGRSMEQRLIALEEQVMHSEHLISELNQVICALQDRLDSQDRLIARLQSGIQSIAEREPEQRSLEDERPPHY